MTFERKHEQLASVEKFVARLLKFAGISLLLVLGSLGFGAWGYGLFAGLTAVDAWHTAAMILFSEGPVTPMTTPMAKIWETFYAAFSGVAFYTIIGAFLYPVFHRLLHTFHIEVVDDTAS